MSARCLARVLNRNYITDCHTATSEWHLVSAFYSYLPYKRCGLVAACACGGRPLARCRARH